MPRTISIFLMCAAIFTRQQTAMNGVLIQMFNHGINVIGLWIVADAIEQQLGTRKFSELGGIAQKAPTLAILFVVMSLANIALPLTNSFIGEFLMFNGLFRYNFLMAAIAAISIILAAVYTLNSIQKIFFGQRTTLTAKTTEVNAYVQFALIVLAALVVLAGVYPQPLLQLTHDSVNSLMAIIGR